MDESSPAGFRKAPEVLNVLYYSSPSKLEEGNESVAPNADLDADFLPHYTAIKDYVTSSIGTDDDIPQQLQTKLDRVQSLARSANTNVYKAADILETLSDATHYGRRAAKDQFKLNGEAKTSLDKCDSSFKEFLQDRMRTEVELAERKLTSCKQYVEEAVDLARRDGARRKDKEIEEDKRVTLEKLKSIRESAVNDIGEDENDLAEIVKNCTSDTKTIETFLQERETMMNKVRTEYTEERRKRDSELVSNRSHQEQLREELRRLEEREAKLQRQNEEEASLQARSNKEFEQVVGDVTEWRSKIETLHQQAQASQEIIATMSECTTLVMKDAKRRKEESKTKLAEMELANCLQLRDALMVMASIHLMESGDCKGTVSVIHDQISHINDEKKNNALTGYKEGVREAETRLKQLQDRSQEYEDRMKAHKISVASLESDLTETDDRIHKLKPHLELDSLDDRYSKRRSGIDLVYSQDSIDAATFCSHGKYKT